MVRRSGCTRFQRRASSGVDDEFPAEVRVVARRCSEGVSAFTLITSTRLTDPAYYQSANVIAENLGQTHQCSRRRKAAMRCVFHVRHWKLQTSTSGAYDGCATHELAPTQLIPSLWTVYTLAMYTSMSYQLRRSPIGLFFCVLPLHPPCSNGRHTTRGKIFEWTGTRSVSIRLGGQRSRSQWSDEHNRLYQNVCVPCMRIVEAQNLRTSEIQQHISVVGSSL